MARQFTKKLAVSFLGTLSTLAFAGTAQADCGHGTYCQSAAAPSSVYHPPALSTWSQHHGVNRVGHHASSSHHNASAPRAITYASAPRSTSYTSSSYTSTAPISYSTSRAVSRAACPAGSTRQADGICLSTSSRFSSSSISQTYSDYSVAPLTRSVVTGLGSNESLRATSCPVSVHNPNGAKVLGCYNVIKPKPVVRTVVRTVPTVYQVVRPVVYVRTPVPVCNTCCTPKKVFSRYGGPNIASGYNQPVSRCGW